MEKGEQDILRCVIMRGGTSKAVFFKPNELPNELSQRDNFILKVFGSPDIRQIDGLGGADVTTSKVAIVGPSSREDADVDYTFGQVSLRDPYIDWNVNCGNISAAVGPFAIDESMVVVQEPETKVRIYNTNTDKVLTAFVPVVNRKASVKGDYSIDGVPGKGARINLDYSNTVGATTGKMLPTGNAMDYIEYLGKKVPVSIVDVANPVLFIPAQELGLSGKESRPELVSLDEELTYAEKLRCIAAEICGFIKDRSEATLKSPVRPKVIIVAPPQEYNDYVTKKIISANEVDFLSRVIWNQMPVETHTGTGAVCATAAAMIPGTVVNNIASKKDNDEVVRIGHPRGVLELECKKSENKQYQYFEKILFGRTARRLMEGYVFVSG